MLSFATISTLAFIAMGVVLLFVILWNTVVLIGGREIAIIERRYFGKKIPPGRVIAMANS